MTYTDVTWLELFGGYLLSGVLAGLLILAIAKALSIRRWAKDAEYRADYWQRFFNKAIAENECLKCSEFVAIDKVKSLEAELSRFKDRKRGKSGRFEKKTGSEK